MNIAGPWSFENMRMAKIIWRPIYMAHKVYEPAGGGSQKLTPIIFLHEILCSKETWDEIPQRVANGTQRKVYTYDARNHGDSDYTIEVSFHFNVYDLFKFMDEMRVWKAVLVGHGMGGMTAITAAIEVPFRIEKVFIVEMCVRRLPRELTEGTICFMNVWEEVVQNLPEDTPPEDVTSTSVETLYERLPPSITTATERSTFMKLKFVYVKTLDGQYDVNFNTKGLAEAIRQYQFWPRERSGEYNEPSYFIFGSFSPFNISSEEASIKKHFPMAQFIQFKGASHHPMVDFPDKFVQTLMNKLNYDKEFQKMKPIF